MVISERYIQNILHIYQKQFKTEKLKEKDDSSLDVANVDDRVFICTEARRKQISDKITIEIVEKLRTNASVDDSG